MNVIDTNIIVRAVIDDSPEETARVASFLARGDIKVPLTVLLEANWVLRKSYGFESTDIVTALLNFTGLPGVHVEDAERFHRAVAYARAGIDFADAMHLAFARDADRFVTFDQDLVRRAMTQGRDCTTP